MSSSNTPMDEKTVIEVSKRTVTEFFEKTNISILTWKPGPERTIVEERVREQVATFDFGDISPRRRDRHTQTSINMAITTFGHTHTDVQVHIAVFTVLALCIDDLEIESRALDEFIQRLHTGSRQLHPVLDHLVDNLKALPQYFPPYSAAAIFAGAVQFINSTVFDKQSENMILTEDSLPYVNYKRARNSLGEVYGFFVWDRFTFPDVSVHIQVIADTMTYLNYANDILSFYKEELAGEATNFVHDRSIATKTLVAEVLSTLLQEVISSVERARTLLKGAEEKEAWERFLAGYVAFHFHSPRYQLVELTGTQYINPDAGL